MEIKKVQLSTTKSANTYTKNRLDFEPFFKYLESFIENGTPSDDMIPLFALERIKEIEHVNGKLCKHNLNAYKDILQLIYSLSVSLIDTDPKKYWALTTPLAEEAFYGTENSRQNARWKSPNKPRKIILYTDLRTIIWFFIQ